MYVVVQHRFKNPQVAAERGQRLIKNEGAPEGVHGLQFYPARDGSGAACLWEAPSVESVQKYVDSTLGDSSDNTVYEIDPEMAFSSPPRGIRDAETARA